MSNSPAGAEGGAGDAKGRAAAYRASGEVRRSCSSLSTADSLSPEELEVSCEDGGASAVKAGGAACEKRGHAEAPAWAAGKDGGRSVGWPETLGSAWNVASLFFRDRQSRCRATTLTVTMCVTMITETVVTSWLSQLVSVITTALVEGDVEGFHGGLLLMLAGCGMHWPLTCLLEWLGGALAIEWRKRITQIMLARYIGDDQAYYRMKFHCGDVDNPDQRIGQDISDFTGSVVKLLCTVIGASMKVMVMSGILIAIAPTLFLYTTVGSTLFTVLFMKVFGGRLMRLNRAVLAQEATLRFGLIRVRENAEAIAFYQGAQFELVRCLQFFAAVTSTLYRRLLVWVAFQGGQRSLFTYSGFLPTLLLGPGILRGEIKFGTIAQTNMLFSLLLHSMTLLISDLGTLAGLGAQGVRIEQLRRLMEGGGDASERCIALLETAAGEGAGPPKQDAEALGPVCLQLANVTLQPPRCSVPTVSDLSLVLRAGQSMLVCGESGIGKSSLLRAIGGLWAGGRGSITRCPGPRCFFVPQEPYLCLGSLRENAAYPGGPADHSDAAIQAALAAANLAYLVPRHGLDAAVDFEGVLSGGEKQRLGFARLLLRLDLQFAILDEATSALDAANEDRLYSLLGERVRCFASVGHRKNLEKFHSHRLLLERGPSGGCAGVLCPLTAEAD